MRCLILDDEPPAREGMRKLLLDHPEVQITGEAGTVDEALALAETTLPEVIFLDVQLRGETGFDFISRATFPLPKIIFVTAHDRFAAAAFRVDAVDYLLKPVEPEPLAEALFRARRRDKNEPLAPIAHPAALQSLGLTAREAEVLFWIAQGKSNPEIADILQNSPGTVKKQVQSILDRLDVGGRVSAALLAAKILGLPRS